jgi:hypothetical protein
MSEERSPDDLDVSGQDGTTWSANGTHAEGAAESPTDLEPAETPTDLEPTETPVTTMEAPLAPADGPLDTAEGTLDTAEGTVDTAAPADEGSAFLGELARAMQTTAAAERARITEDSDGRRDAYLAAIQARREAEVASMRELADTDLKAIDDWADEERQRIQAERERRAAALQADLEISLAEHGKSIDREIQGVEAAIATYRADVDRFFAALEHETDPVAIAQRAGRRPAFPALESIIAEPAAAPDDGVTPGGAVTGDAATAQQPVGVMDPGFAPKLADAWAAWSGTQAAADEETSEPGAIDQTEWSEPVVAGAAEATFDDASAIADASGPEALEAVAVTSAATHTESTGLLQSTPVNRPMSWLRRAAGTDHSNRES